MKTEVHKKLMAYINAVPHEISGLGLIRMEKYPDGADFFIDELFLLKQDSSDASTVLDPLAIGKLIFELNANGIDTGGLKLWWHSHAKMTVFWSGGDESTISSLGTEWMLSLVGNHRGNMLARVDIYNPFRVTIDNIPIIQTADYDPALEAQVQKEVLEKVTYLAPPPLPPLKSRYPNWKQFVLEDDGQPIVEDFNG